MAQVAVSSPASAQKTNNSGGLGTGTIVGIILGVLIIVITIIATVWYVWRSHHTGDATQLEDLAAAKAAELESSRATAETDSVHMRNEKFSYPVGVGEDPSPPRQELDSRPYWGRPF